MWLPCKKISDILQNPGILWLEWGWTGLSAKNKIRVWMWESVDSVVLPDLSEELSRDSIIRSVACMDRNAEPYNPRV